MSFLATYISGFSFPVCFGTFFRADLSLVFARDWFLLVSCVCVCVCVWGVVFFASFQQQHGAKDRYSKESKAKKREPYDAQEKDRIPTELRSKTTEQNNKKEDKEKEQRTTRKGKDCMPHKKKERRRIPKTEEEEEEKTQTDPPPAPCIL